MCCCAASKTQMIPRGRGYGHGLHVTTSWGHLYSVKVCKYINRMHECMLKEGKPISLPGFHRGAGASGVPVWGELYVCLLPGGDWCVDPGEEGCSEPRAAVRSAGQHREKGAQCHQTAAAPHGHVHVPLWGETTVCVPLVLFNLFRPERLKHHQHCPLLTGMFWQ